MTGPTPDHDRAVQDTDRLREVAAEAEALRRNGPASDGRGWYRTAADRVECFAIADAVLAAVLAAARTLVPQMAAEVAELRGQRDDATEWADRLADAVAILTGRDMGEHSNMNNPWENAVEALIEYARQAGEVR